MWTCPNCDSRTDDGFDICWTCRVPKGQRSIDASNRQDFIVSTTPTIVTHDIVEYFWPVFGETVWGANILRDFAATFTDGFGGRSGTYEDVLKRGREEAILELKGKAKRIGANAVLDLDVKYETLNGSMFMICVSGTAVRVRPKADSTSTEASSTSNPTERSDGPPAP